MRVCRLVSVVVLLLVVGACSARGPIVHTDDEAHPLSLIQGASGSVTLLPPEGRAEGEIWAGTFGTFLPCVTGDKGPAEITEIEWTSDTALEPESVETFVHSFDRATSSPFISMLGTPLDPQDEDFAGEVRPNAVGFVATASCDDIPGSDGQMDEVMVALSAGDAGGHIGDLRFHYEAGGDSYILEIGWDYYLCGSAVPDEFECP